MRGQRRTKLRSRSLVAALATAILAALLPGASLGTQRSVAASQGKAAAQASVALDWNANAVAAVRAALVTEPLGTAPRSIYQTEGLLYLSYVQAAVYDAVTKIGHRYAPYHHFSAPAGNASIEAAAIAAAYNTLVHYLGDPGGSLAAKYAASIGALPDDRSRTRGIAVGEAAAADLEALREGDGRNAPVSTAFGAGPPQPGLWIFAPPPSLQSAQLPWMAVMEPFMLENTAQFRAPAPPPLSSAQYAADLSETQAYGSKTSAVRNADQTATAYFWNANTINQLNQTLRDVSTQHALDLVDTARLLAAGNMVSTDAGMACFDSKYTYQLWRPVTAIRTTDPLWTPLVTTPNHPEYPSQHGCVTSALAEVLADAVGTRNIDVTIWGAETGAATLTTSRTYATVDDLESELVNARVWIGFHFRNSVVAGEDLGTSVASWELQRYFLPTDDEDSSG